MPETHVDLEKIEAAFEKKLNDKDSAIANLSKELEAFKNSIAKGELDKRDVEIKELKASLEKTTKEVKIAQELVAQKDLVIKANEEKITETATELKTATDEVEKVTKELDEVKAKQVLSTRIAAYRTKSTDATSKDEDLAKKFGGLSDEAFATIMEFVKPIVVAPVVESVADLAAQAVANKTEPVVVPPTETQTDQVSVMSAVAKRLFAEFNTEVKN